MAMTDLSYHMENLLIDDDDSERTDSHYDCNNCNRCQFAFELSKRQEEPIEVFHRCNCHVCKRYSNGGYYMIFDRKLLSRIISIDEIN
jgi:hypothetical protein